MLAPDRLKFELLEKLQLGEFGVYLGIEGMAVGGDSAAAGRRRWR